MQFTPFQRYPGRHWHRGPRQTLGQNGDGSSHVGVQGEPHSENIWPPVQTAHASVLHGTTRVVIGHSAPISLGCEVIVRYCVRVPPPHDCEHEEPLTHSLVAQLTEKMRHNRIWYKEKVPGSGQSSGGMHVPACKYRPGGHWQRAGWHDELQAGEGV